MQCKQSKTKTCKHNTKKERGLEMEYFRAMAKSACERFIESVQPVLSQSVSFCATRARARARARESARPRRAGPTVRHGFCAILHQCFKILANELPQFRHSFSALVHMGGARCRGVASVWCRWVWSTAPVHLCTALVRAVKVMRQ